MNLAVLNFFKDYSLIFIEFFTSADFFFCRFLDLIKYLNPIQPKKKFISQKYTV